MSSINIQINLDRDESIVEFPASNKREWIESVQNLLKGISGGIYPASLEQISTSANLVRATGTITVASILAADTITINNSTITASATPVGATQFQSAGANNVVATAIAACINANPAYTGYVVATASSAVVTVSAYVQGVIGNAVTLASSNGTRLAVSGARLASGTGLAELPVVYGFGK
jgi:hypothetical protein